MTTHYLKVWHPMLNPVEKLVRLLGVKLRQVLTFEGDLSDVKPGEIIIGKCLLGRFGVTAEIVEKPKS
jgi:hypothetical protein